MGLTKEQWIKLSMLFHHHYDELAETSHMPVASFSAVVDIAEEFLGETSEQPPVDSLPVEDVVTIENYKAFLKKSPDVTSIAFRLSDGETLYTLTNEA